MSLTAWNLPYIINMPSSLEELGGSLDAAQCVEFTIYNTSSSLEELRASLDAAESLDLTIEFLTVPGADHIRAFEFVSITARATKTKSYQGVVNSYQ